MSSVFKIVPTTQQYDWGKIGSNSKVAQLAAASEVSDFVLEEAKPYAELWMGTHPTSPSLLPSSPKSTLSSHLKSHPSLIGTHVAERFPGAEEGNLPFLFKVLSIEKALSIQTHPDKKTAETLHAQFPKIYKDDNHKPELALALTPFRALCGFQPLPSIAQHLSITPELTALIPPSIVDAFQSISSTPNPTSPEAKTALRDLFSSLMTADEKEVKKQADALVERYITGGPPLEGSVEELAVKLSPGEAIFLGAGEPHAYVDGDIIECMANSDNVIRAGLTPKLRDIPNLIAGLTYVPAEADRHRVQPSPFPPSAQLSMSVLYDPPIPEFSVVQVKVSGQSKETHPPIDGPSLAVITEGKGIVSWKDEAVEQALDIKQGDVIFVGAGSEIQLSGENLVLYRAFVEV